MLITPHVLVGSLVGVKLCSGKEKPSWTDAVLVSFLAFVSHFVLDSFPHWHYATIATPEKQLIQFVALDIAVTGFLLSLSVRDLFRPDFLKGLWRYRLMLWGGFAAIVPDIILTLGRLHHISLEALQWFGGFHSAMHTRVECPAVWGIIIQLIVIVICFVGIYRQASSKKN